MTTGRSSGVAPQIRATYEIPVRADDTTLSIQFSKNDFTVIEAPFGDLAVESDSSGFGLTLRHPAYRTLNTELVVGVSLERIENRTFLLGEPFSFALGADDGRSNVTSLRISQDWTHRSQNQALAFGSRLSFGLDLFGATVHGDDSIYRQIAVEDPPDGRFLSWLGKFQWARRIGPAQVIFRTDAQLSADPLLATEQLRSADETAFAGIGRTSLSGTTPSSARSRPASPWCRIGNGHAAWSWLRSSTSETDGRPTPIPPVAAGSSSPYRLQHLQRRLRRPMERGFRRIGPLEPRVRALLGKGLVDLDSASRRGGSLQDSGIHFNIGLGVF